jgi:hypothetical protein
MAAKRLNDMDRETIERNFLKEEQDCLPTEEQVVIAKEIPKYERIIFVNNRDPGCALYFHYATKTHPLKHYTLMHGLEYNLPVEVIKHLEGQNKDDPYSCHSRIYSERKNYEGMPENYVSGYKPYFQCRAVRA